MKQIISVFKYFHFTTLLKSKISEYFIMLKVMPLIIYVLAIIMIILIFQIKNHKLKSIWLLTILRIFLPIISIGLFGQILLFFLLLFDCEDGHHNLSEKLECRNGDWFILHSPFIIIAMILHFFISLITNTLYYKSLYDVSKSDALKKTSSVPEISLFFTKFFLTLLLVLYNQEEMLQWIILFLLMIVTGFNAYINILFKNKLNLMLMSLSIIFSLILFFGCFTLFIGNIFKYFGYNGSIFFYFIIIIIIILFIILHKANNIKFGNIDYKNINNSDQYIVHLLRYYLMIISKKNSRNCLTVLKSFLEAIEETCVDIHCPLKVYLEKLKHGIDCQYLLYEYLDKMYRFGISKFKNNVILKNNYSLFLMTIMNNKKQALIVSNSINQENTSFLRNYNIYKCKKVINACNSEKNNFYYNYRKNANEFTNLISKISNLYYKFWSLLYESKFQQKNNFIYLYELGSEIMEINKKIEKLYNLLIITKTSNIEIYKLYSEYIEIILNNEEKYLKYINNYKSIYSQTVENEVKNYSNFNIDNLKHKNNSTFLLVSGAKKNLGTILNCSMSASTVFGYTKEELIGKHINIIIPDLFHHKHNKVIGNQSKKYEIELLDDLFQKKLYNPTFKEGKFFGIVKSKFIKLLKLKIYYVKTEDNIISFVIEIMVDIPYMGELIKNKEINNSDIDNRCCILTNENFLIQEFTPNSIEQLGLSYRYIKSNNSIIPYIKQLNEDYLNKIKELSMNHNKNNEMISNEESSRLSEIKEKNDISFEIKRKIKDELVNKKYNKKCQITWRIRKKIYNDKIINKNKENEVNKINCSRISYRGSNYNILNNKKDEIRFEVVLIMEIKKAILDNELLGYYFYFSKLNPSEDNNFISYSLTKKNDIDNDKKEGTLKKTIKYKLIFQNPEFISNEINKKQIYHSDLNHHNNINNNNKENDRICNSLVSKSSKIKGSLENKVSNIINSSYDEFGQKIKNISKFSSSKDNEIYEVIIDENFIPKYNISFSLDINNMCYNIDNNNKYLTILTEKLHKEALTKLKEYQDYLNKIKQKEKESEKSGSNSEDNYNSNSDEDSESSDKDKESSSNISVKRTNSSPRKISLKKSITLTNTVKTRIEPSSPIKGSYTLKKIKEAKEDIKKYEQNDENKMRTNSNLSLQIKKYEGKNYINNYYKVNLNKMHFMIFDFNKEMIIEGNKDEIAIKIDNIINNSKKENEINLGKDENYPYFSFKNNKDEKKNKKLKTNNIINNTNQNQISEERLLSRKINEAINVKSDDEGVKLLLTHSIISSIVMIILALLYLFFNLYFYKRINQVVNLIKNTIRIKYCNIFSKYFVRELTLINFNFPSIKGGIYENFPGKDRKKYINLLQKKFEEYFLETQINLKQILSTSYSYSQNIEKSLSETTLESKYTSAKGFGQIEANILTTLMQYNTVFYNLASRYNPLYQNVTDVYIFLDNSYNNYLNALVILLDNYGKELKKQNKDILIYSILCIILVLIMFVIFSFFVILSFISATINRINYMKVFYGINSNSIKNLMINCEKLTNRLKIKDNNNNEEDLDEEEEEKDKNNIFQKKTDILSKSLTLTKNNDSKKESTTLSLFSKLFIIFYIIYMIGEYAYFPYNGIFLYNVNNKSFDIFSFFLNINDFHSKTLDIFNVYREYLFDNKSSIQNTTPFDYLIYLENNTYETITEQIKSIQTFIGKNINKTDEFTSFSTKDLCSFYITDYFESTEECKSKYSYIIIYGFNIFVTNFIQIIRNLKNIVRYKHETEYIFGELSGYENIKYENLNNNNYEGMDKLITFKLDLFNNKTLHSDINIIYINFFLPYIDEIRKIIINNLSLEGQEYIFITFFCIFFSLMFFLFFFCFLPIIRFLNNSIYKTKKLLLLIPMKILAAQGNIKSLLKLV